MSKLWGMIILVGVIFGAAGGAMGAITEQALSSAKEAVTLCLAMAGVMAFWMGMMEIAGKMGLIGRLSAGMHRILGFLFPDLPEGHPARPHIAANLIANVFGLGWAATPAGLAAMRELARGREGQASDTMCDFLILNISSLQLIPVNIIAFRSQYGSEDPAAVIGPAILATLASTCAAIVFIRMRHRIAGGRAS